MDHSPFRICISENDFADYDFTVLNHPRIFIPPDLAVEGEFGQ